MFKLFVYERAEMIMLAKGIRIQLNQSAYDVLRTNNKKDTFCFTLISACKTHFKQTYCEICHETVTVGEFASKKT